MRRMRTGRDAAPAGPVYATGSPGVSGDTARPNYVGPSGNGLVGADERRAKNLRDQGRSVWPPLSVWRRRSRDLRKTPQWGAERRAGTRYGPAVPSRWRDGRDRKVRQWVRRSAPANFGAPLPSDGDAKGSKPTIWHDSPPGCAARQRSPTAQQMHGEITMTKYAHITCLTLHRHARAQPSEGRRRYARLCRGHPRLGTKSDVDGRDKARP